MGKHRDSAAADHDQQHHTGGGGQRVGEDRLRWEVWCTACRSGRGAALAYCTDELVADLKRQAARHNRDAPGHTAVVQPRGTGNPPKKEVPQWLEM